MKQNLTLRNGIAYKVLYIEIPELWHNTITDLRKKTGRSIKYIILDTLQKQLNLPPLVNGGDND